MSDAPHEKYVEGHAAGYVKGRDDGIAIGYSDAKLRAYLALDSVAALQSIPAAVRQVENALAQMLGKR